MRLRTKYKRVKEELKRYKPDYIPTWREQKKWRLEEIAESVIVPDIKMTETTKEGIKRRLAQMIAEQVVKEGKIEFTYKKVMGDRIAVTGRMKTLKEVE